MGWGFCRLFYWQVWLKSQELWVKLRATVMFLLEKFGVIECVRMWKVSLTP